MGTISSCSLVTCVLERELGIKFRGYVGICGVTELLLRLCISCAFCSRNECLIGFQVFLVHHKPFHLTVDALEREEAASLRRT